MTGTPEIDVYWFKEGSEIIPSDSYKIAYVNGMATLEVCGADIKDSGIYYCEARNEAGSESCSMELKVKGQSDAQGAGNLSSTIDVFLLNFKYISMCLSAVLTYNGSN